MIPVKQLYRHNPDKGVWGDCHRAAIACVLRMRVQDVPHFFDQGASGPEGNAHAEFWLRRRGICTIQFCFPGEVELSDVLNTVAAMNGPDCVYLLGGKSRTDCGHTVVCRGHQIVCDPSLTDAGIVAPMSDGRWWLTFFGSTRTLAAGNAA